MNPVTYLTLLYVHLRTALSDRDEAGQSLLVEVLILAGVLIVVILAAMPGLRDRVIQSIGNLFDKVDAT